MAGCEKTVLALTQYYLILFLEHSSILNYNVHHCIMPGAHGNESSVPYLGGTSVVKCRARIKKSCSSSCRLMSTTAPVGAFTCAQKSLLV